MKNDLPEKRRKFSWGWALVLVLLLAIAIFVYCNRECFKPGTPTATSDPTVETVPASKLPGYMPEINGQQFWCRSNEAIIWAAPLIGEAISECVPLGKDGVNTLYLKKNWDKGTMDWTDADWSKMTSVTAFPFEMSEGTNYRFYTWCDDQCTVNLKWSNGDEKHTAEPLKDIVFDFSAPVSETVWVIVQHEDFEGGSGIVVKIGEYTVLDFKFPDTQ